MVHGVQGKAEHRDTPAYGHCGTAAGHLVRRAYLYSVCVTGGRNNDAARVHDWMKGMWVSA